MESPNSNPVKSIINISGMLDAGQDTSILYLTIFNMPPILIPGHSSSFSNFTGISIVTFVSSLTLKKSMCSALSVIGCNVIDCGSTSVFSFSTSKLHNLLKKPSFLISAFKSLSFREMDNGSNLAPYITAGILPSRLKDLELPFPTDSLFSAERLDVATIFYSCYYLLYKI